MGVAHIFRHVAWEAMEYTIGTRLHGANIRDHNDGRFARSLGSLRCRGVGMADWLMLTCYIARYLLQSIGQRRLTAVVLAIASRTTRLSR